MAVQKKILTRTFTGTVKYIDTDGSEKTKSYTVNSGALIGGTPGQIYDVAYGPVIHTTVLETASDIGSFVANHGVIVNAPEYALYGTARAAGNDDTGPLAPTLTLPIGTVVSCMTAGHVWIKAKDEAAVLAGMNASVIWKQDGATGDDLIIVEVNGLKSSDAQG